MSPIDTARDALIELYGAVGLLNGVMRDHQLDWRRSGPLPDKPIPADAPRPQNGVFVPKGKKVKDFSTLHAGRWKFKGHRKGWNRELAEAIGDIPSDAEHFTYAAGRLWAELIRLWDAHAAALKAIEPLNIRLDGTADARLKLRRFADDAVRQVNYSPNWRRKIDAVLPMLANLRANPEWQLPDCLVDAFELCEQLRIVGAYAEELPDGNVNERTAAFIERYGRPNKSEPGEVFVTFDKLGESMAELRLADDNDDAILNRLKQVRKHLNEINDGRILKISKKARTVAISRPKKKG